MNDNFKYKFLREKVGKKHFFSEVSAEGAFWSLRAKKTQVQREGIKNEEENWENVGWKLHISLADSGDNIERAWDLIVDLLRVYGVKTCKVLAEGCHLPAFQRGKEITIYYQKEKIEWQALLDEITKRFIDNNILPDYLAFSDQSVDGAVFFGYRNDQGFDGKYADGLTAQNFNPTNQPMPPEWLKLKITHMNQPVKPFRQNAALMRDFYRNTLSDVVWASRYLVRLLMPFSSRLKKLGENCQIWNFDELEIANICFGVPEAFRKIIANQFYEIKEVQKITDGDLLEQSELGIRQLTESCKQRVKDVEDIIVRVDHEIKALNMSPASEQMAAFIGTVNSGNVSSASNESSPAKTTSSEDTSPRSTDDDQGMVLGPSQKK